MLPMLSSHHFATQLQLSLYQVFVGSSCRLRPLLNALCSQQQQQVDLGHQFASSSRGIVTGHTHIPRVQHDRYRTAPQNYVQLLQHITRSRDVEALSKLVKQYGGKFDAVHVAAAVAMVPKLYQPPAPGNHLNDKQLKERKKVAAKLLAQLQVTAASQVPRMFAPQVSSITYALSRCSSLLPGGSTANKTTQQLLDAMLARMTKDQSRLLWQGADGSSIAYLLHGLSRMGYSPSVSKDPASSSSSVGTSGSAAVAALHTTQQLCRMIVKNAARLQVRELATSAWALARISRNVQAVRTSPTTAAALDAISEQVVARKLWLRPTSMTGLLTAAVWLERKDEAMLAAVCEEATHQVRDLQPDHLAAFAWALSSLDCTPPAELLSGIVAESRRKLQGFTASSLGLLLLGLRGLQALDKQLLAEVAAGIAAEPEVALAPRDAARILAAFVAVPDAGTKRDVEGMAQRIASAIRRAARRARPRLLTELVLCYSRLPHHHPMLAELLGEAGDRGSSFALRHWATLLQSAQQLGYGQVMADPQLEATLWSFYKAANARLRQHVREEVLGRGKASSDSKDSSAAVAKQQASTVGQAEGDGVQQAGSGEEPEEEGLGGKASKLWKAMQQVKPKGTAPARQVDGQVLSHREAAVVAQIAELLGQRGSLSDATATDLADAGMVLLPVLKLRSIMQLLSGVTSKDPFLADDSVRNFVVAACDTIKALDLGSTPTATTSVLVGLLPPLSKAISRNLIMATGEDVMRSIYAELLPVLEQCSQEQLQSVWQAMRRSGVEDEGLAGRAKEIAQRHGWKLQSGALTMV